MSFSPAIIKPCRTQSKSPKLTKAKAVKNAKKFVETSLILDLNILSKMNEVIKKETSYLESGLQGFVSFINKTPALYLTPGFATIEADKEWLNEIMDSYEKFLEIYAKAYSDHPNATKNFLDNPKIKNTKFSDLPINEKYFNSIAYIGVMKIWLIQKSQRNLSAKEKYSNYITYMENTVDMIGAIEAEVAKYVFFDRDCVKDEKFKTFCKDIHDNFNKRKNSNVENNILKDRLNAARDIMYFRSTALMSNRTIDDRVQDTWLVTADKGLLNLTESIYFVPEIENSDSKYVTYSRHQEQENSDYWIFCDKLTDSKLRGRELLNYTDNEKEYNIDVLLAHIKELETEVESFSE